MARHTIEICFKPLPDAPSVARGYARMGDRWIDLDEVFHDRRLLKVSPLEYDAAGNQRGYIEVEDAPAGVAASLPDVAGSAVLL